jgi:hypothetical protein
MGLSTADLTYDPTTSTAANADAVLTIGASMLSVVNSAATLASSIGGSGTTAAAATVFAEMAKLSGSDLAKLTGSDSTLVGGVLTTLMNSTLTSVGVDASSYSTAVNAASASTASVSAAVRGLSSAAIRSGELAQLAKAGQETLIADVKSLAAAAASGEDISAKVTALSSNYAGSNMATLKAAAAQKLAFNRSDPLNPITTTADSFTIEAPAGGVAVTKLFNPLSNDSLKGGGTLTLAAVGLFDPRSNSGKIATLTQNTVTLGDGASAQSGFYNGMSIVVLTANGPLNGTITSYNGATRTATLDKSLFGQGPVVVPPKADYLISKVLPPNIQLGIENNQIKVINSYNKDSQFGSYDLIYVTAKSDDPTIAKTGLATINVLPPAPTISHGAQAATSKRYTATEAVNDNVSAADNTAELALLGGAQKSYTLVNLPLTVQGLGLDGQVQIKGLPTGSLLKIQVGGQSKIVSADAITGSPSWTIKGADAIAADYATLKVLIPADLAAEYSLTILASSRYAGLSTTVRDTATVAVTPTTDGLRIEPSDISGINQKLNDFVPDAVNEDTQFEFQKLLNNANPIKAFLDTAASKLIDTGSEKLGLRIELAEGFTGTFTQTNLATRSGSAGDGKTYVEV